MDKATFVQVPHAAEMSAIASSFVINETLRHRLDFDAANSLKRDTKLLCSGPTVQVTGEKLNDAFRGFNLNRCGLLQILRKWKVVWNELAHALINHEAAHQVNGNVKSTRTGLLAVSAQKAYQLIRYQRASFQTYGFDAWFRHIPSMRSQ